MMFSCLGRFCCGCDGTLSSYCALFVRSSLDHGIVGSVKRWVILRAWAYDTLTGYVVYAFSSEVCGITPESSL